MANVPCAAGEIAAQFPIIALVRPGIQNKFGNNLKTLGPAENYTYLCSGKGCPRDRLLRVEVMLPDSIVVRTGNRRKGSHCCLNRSRACPRNGDLAALCN